MTRSDDKTQFLKQQGLLHPTPQGVPDPLFAYSDFFDPRDLVLVKVEMLRCVRVEQTEVTEATRRFGLSRPSFYQARRRFNQDGLIGLIPKQRGPRKPHKLTEKVMRFLLQQQAESASLSGDDLAQKVKQHMGVSVHPRTIERALHGSRQKKGRGTNQVNPPSSSIGPMSLGCNATRTCVGASGARRFPPRRRAGRSTW